MAPNTNQSGALADSSERLASSVARRIEDDIITMGWPVGQTMGSEAQLIADYGVSRGVLREAIRLLEHKQVARMRSGPNGGLTISAPAASAIAETVANYFDFASVTIDSIVEARRFIEVAALRLAADRTSGRSISDLRRAAGDDDPSAVHRAVAELTRNPALSIVVEALLQASPAAPHNDSQDGRPPHRGPELVDAFVRGDLGRAEMLLVDHIDAARQQSDPHTVDTAINPAQHLKLPELVARRIVSDLRAGFARPGDIIGSEVAFTERYEISRAVFRQAIRILEYYDIVRMRRGPGGGVMVGNADPSHVADAVITYLDFMRLDREHLREARRVVEIAAVHLAVERLDDDGAAQLRAELEAESQVGLGTVYRRAPDLHVLVGELSGNAALAFFVRVLTRLQTSRIGSVPRTDEERAHIGGGISLAHHRLVEAMIDGDVGLSRQRLRRHLSDMTNFVATERVLNPAESA